MKLKMKQFIKFLFVVASPLVALMYYVIYMNEILGKSSFIIYLYTMGLFLVFFNAIFYSFHMSKVKLFSRWSVTIFKGFGLMAAVEDDCLIIVIACFGISFRYNGVFT
jgi:CBS domain containing-hemolysin-like protein